MHKTFNKENRSVDIMITRKKRKTMGIYIDVYGNIELRVPATTTDEAIEKLVMTKWNWITTRSDEMREKTKGFKEKEYENGETFLFLGKNYPIELVIDERIKRPVVKLVEKNGADNQERISLIEITTPTRDEEVMKKAMTRFYKQQCKRTVEERIRHYQPNFKMKPKSVRITSNKKTWGTCSSLRELTFNWKLAMAPIDVIDYVVVHEMCHMLHMNHDRSFWRLVGKYVPDYEERQNWLKQSHWKMVV